MTAIRSLFAQRHLAVLLCAAALLLKLIVPTGYMVGPVDGGMGVVLCPGSAPLPSPSGHHVMPGHDATAHVATGHPPGHSDKGHGRDLPCAFSGLAAPVLATTDPIQLVLLIAFVMAAGIAWGTPLRRPAVPRSRPPSRGPPALS
ncbi:hypothetical protein [Sphingomonas sp. PB1R3]|uniref:hypothetical protein n=1 Tax=Sphingomonas flavida TaxID=3096154 RepID=UPI002FCB5A87